MSHPDARLTRQSRLDLVLGVAGGWTQAEAARQHRVSRATAAKWVRRYRDEGRADLRDRCSRPHRSPRLTPPPVAADVLRLRRERDWGRRRIAWDLGVEPPAACAVLRRAGLHRRDRRRRVSREVVRYERERPGELLHLDVKKLGRIPPGGGKRFAPGFAETGSGPKGKGGGGPGCVHVAIDDRSRCARAGAAAAGGPRPSGGGLVHPSEDRGLMREAALLQGFPPDYRFHGPLESVEEQIGNAVPPPLARVAALALLADAPGSA